MEWDEEAQALLKKVPFFVRPKARREIEALVKARGGSRVTREDVLKARQAVAQKMSRATQGYTLDPCFGNGGCPNSLADTQVLLERLEKTLEEARLLSFLQEKIEGPVRHSHLFRVAVANCPNACSQVQIRDFGVIAREYPRVNPHACNGCGECTRACKEGAISMEGERPVIAPHLCLGCGDCRKTCPQGAMESQERGYTVLVGGKLGRHPQLARPLLPMATEEEVVRALEAALALYKRLNQEGERLGTIIQNTGWEKWRELFFQAFS